MKKEFCMFMIGNSDIVKMLILSKLIYKVNLNSIILSVNFLFCFAFEQTDSELSVEMQRIKKNQKDFLKEEKKLEDLHYLVSRLVIKH